MNWKYGLKVFTLSLALSVTLYSMYLLNTGHSKDFFTSLGFQSSQELNWCTERLQKAEGLQSPWTLEEKNRSWILTLPAQNPLTVSYLDIEKWLARYCSVAVQPVAKEKILDLQLQPALRLFFNDGQKVLVYQKDLRIFQINEVTFESAEFQEALETLRDLLKISL